MTKSELENKHISELHSLAAEAGVERFRLLSKAELVERLADGDGGESEGGGSRGSRSRRGAREGAGADREQRSARGESEGGERPQRSRRRRGRGPREESSRDEDAAREERPAADKRDRGARPAREAKVDASSSEPAAAEPSPAPAAEEPAKPRRRRRRRFGRRGKQGVTLQGLLLPPEAGRQTLLLAESREACTALLRSVAADLAADSKGPDPVALLIDPSPEELGDWKREAPQAEIVAAGQPRHADDALAQAKSRAAGGEDVILLVDSLTRLGEAYGDAEAAKDFFDAGRIQGSTGGGSLTVVAALERS